MSVIGTPIIIGGKGGMAPEVSPLMGFEAIGSDGEITLAFTVPDDIVSFKIVYREDKYPVSQLDGIVLDNPISGSVISGLDNWKTYYFRAYTFGEGGATNADSVGNLASAAPRPPVTMMGVRHEIANSSPALVRLGDAAGLSAVAGIGTVPQISDFDTMPIYREIRRCNLAADGAVLAWEGEDGFSTDAADVMVFIPKFWYKRVYDGVYDEWWIADGPAVGFDVHPVFTPGASYGEIDGIFVSAYEASAGYKSISGQSPLVSITRRSAGNGAKAKGAGWSQLDIAAVCAINLLIYTEYATLNGQTAIGSGNSSTSAAIKTGTTDSMAGHTGRAAGTDAAVGMKWRGVENWWGNVWKWVDGLNINAYAYYYCLNPNNYADDTTANYTAAGLTAPSGASESHIKELGCNDACSWLMVPTAIGGAANTYFCDGLWTNSGWRVVQFGGGWTHGALCGPAGWALNSDASRSATHIGYRLLYRKAS